MPDSKHYTQMAQAIIAGHPLKEEHLSEEIINFYEQLHKALETILSAAYKKHAQFLADSVKLAMQGLPPEAWDKNVVQKAAHAINENVHDLLHKNDELRHPKIKEVLEEAGIKPRRS